MLTTGTVVIIRPVKLESIEAPVYGRSFGNASVESYKSHLWQTAIDSRRLMFDDPSHQEYDTGLARHAPKTSG